MTVSLTNPFGQSSPPLETSGLMLPSGNGTITPSVMTGDPDDDDSTGGLSSLLGSASSALPIAGTAISILTSLFEGHEVRAKDAANENTAMNQIIPYVTQAFLQLVAGMKAGKYTQAQAQQVVSNIVSTYNSFVKSLQGKPGIADNGNPPGGVCGKLCTAGCCLRGGYVNVIAMQVLNALSGAKNSNTSDGHWNLGTTGIPADKYGFAGVPAYSVPIVFNPSTSIKGAEAKVSNLFSKFVAFLKGL